VKAPQMQRYMKSAMPFLGVPAPGVKQAVRGVPRLSPLSRREATKNLARLGA
jgi:DNA alkylation repair enzyme